MAIPRFRSLLPKVSQTIKQFRSPIGSYTLIFVRFWRFVLEVTCSSRLYENKRTFSVNLSCPSLDDSDWRGMSMLDLFC